MIVQIFAIYDRRSKTFYTPEFSPNKDVYVRHLISDIIKPNSLICSNLSDFCFAQLGEFDVESGIISPCDILLQGFEEVFSNEICDNL